MRIAWLALVVLLSLAVVAQARSGGPPASTVMADNGCSCHSADPNANTVVTVTFPAQYLGAARHPIKITSTTDVAQNPVGNKGGFLAWVSKGSFAKRSGSEDWYQTGTLSNGTWWIEHNGKGDSDNAAQQWLFDWIPPTSDVGPVTLKVFVNRVNGDGTNSDLDHWNRRSIVVPAGPAGTASMTPSTATKTFTTASTPPTSHHSTPVTTTDKSPGLGLAIVAGVLGVLALAYRRR
jgi:hypothetical protein